MWKSMVEGFDVQEMTKWKFCHLGSSRSFYEKALSLMFLEIVCCRKFGQQMAIIYDGYHRVYTLSCYLASGGCGA